MKKSRLTQIFMMISLLIAMFNWLYLGDFQWGIWFFLWAIWLQTAT